MMATIQLNRALLLEAPVDAADGAGGAARDWRGLGTHWAQVEAGTGREVAGEEISLARTSYRITLRAAPPESAQRPLAGQRFREGTRIFAILAVAEFDPAGQWLLCHCHEESPR